MSLEYAAMRWLWLEKKCHIVLEQRSPIYCMGLPDVMGVTVGRHLIEIEVKRSAADFAADFKKPHRINQAHHPEFAPRQFYYLMPPELAKSLSDKIPVHAGLMTVNSVDTITVLKVAPVNKASPKLNSKQCVRLARQMTAHMMGYVVSNRSMLQTWKYNSNFYFQDWIECEKGTYEI